MFFCIIFELATGDFIAFAFIFAYFYRDLSALVIGQVLLICRNTYDKKVFDANTDANTD